VVPRSVSLFTVVFSSFFIYFTPYTCLHVSSLTVNGLCCGSACLIISIDKMSVSLRPPYESSQLLLDETEFWMYRISIWNNHQHSCEDNKSFVKSSLFLVFLYIDLCLHIEEQNIRHTLARTAVSAKQSCNIACHIAVSNSERG
ncbi:unnamed protein product, partial [Pylaiella littoralis]